MRLCEALARRLTGPTGIALALASRPFTSTAIEPASIGGNKVGMKLLREVASKMM